MGGEAEDLGGGGFGEGGFFALEEGFVDTFVGGGRGGSADEADDLGDGGVGAEEGEEVGAEGAGGAGEDLRGCQRGLGRGEGVLATTCPSDLSLRPSAVLLADM